MTVKHFAPIIKVTDMKSALDFYCSVLGFEVDFEFALTETGPFYTGISLEGHHLHLSTFFGDGVTGTATYCYVDDVDGLHSRFLARGLTKTDAGPVNQTWGMREIYVRDPDGNTLRFGSEIEGPVPEE